MTDGFTLITYDIADRKRLARVAKVAEAWGERVQRSVFITRTSQRDVIWMREAFEREMDPKRDKLLIIRVVGTLPPEMLTVGPQATLQTPLFWAV